SGQQMGEPVNISQATVASDINGAASETGARRARRNAILGSAIGYATDGFDLLILGFMLRPISADLGLTQAQGASLVTATLFGAVIGGFGFGWLSDRLGRVRVLVWTIVLFAAFTGLCALAQGYWDLLIYRTIAGIGLGGEFGIGMALVAEAWPAAKRARATSYVALGWQAGVLAGALLSPILLPHIGWRGMFVVGILPAIVAFAVRRLVEEPAMFVEASKKERINPYGTLFANRDSTRATVGIAIMTSAQNFGYYGIMIWLPVYLQGKMGFSITRS